MSRQIRFLFYSMVIIIAALSASTTFFYAKSNKSKGKTERKVSVQSSVTSIAKITDVPSSDTNQKKATSSKDEPSHPVKIYTIKAKDTLFSIAQENGLTMEELSIANGITDANKIQSGQVIVIPKGAEVEYEIDQDQSDYLQKQIENGKEMWRIDPVETSQLDAPIIYGLKTGDSFTLESKNLESGIAVVKATSENGFYEIKLIQPNAKGEKGIWAIKSVKKIDK